MKGSDEGRPLEIESSGERIAENVEIDTLETEQELIDGRITRLNAWIDWLVSESFQ